MDLRWATAAALAVLGLVLLFFHVTYSFAVFAMSLYVACNLGLRTQSSPAPLKLRVFQAAAIWLCTSLVTASPWLFLGGMQGCREFDPKMKTSYGYAFDQVWTLLYFRHGLNWSMTLAATYLVLADHPPSTYIRDCLRCFLYFYGASIVATLATTWVACRGTDENEDGIRDSMFDEWYPMNTSVVGALQASSRVGLILAGLWFVRIMVKKIRALEEAFGEPLPYSAAIVRLSSLLACAFCGFFFLQVSRLATFLGGLAGCLALSVLTVLKLLALRVPLRALQSSRSCGGGQWTMKVDRAVAALWRLQVAMSMGNSCIILFVVTMGYSFWSQSYEAATIQDYSSWLGAAGSSACLVLLTSGSLRLPRQRGRGPPGTQPLEEAPQIQERVLHCTCDTRWSLRDMRQSLSHVPRLSSLSKRASARTGCERCAWEHKVQELASRRISAEQLLDFFARLRCASEGEVRQMLHFDPARSTTNDVVRHAIIPLSRCGDVGRSLAEVLQASPSRSGCLGSTTTVRMVTHHWANRFRDLVAAVVADSLGLQCWDSVAEQLSAGKEKKLRERLYEQGSWHWEYWICAFCINQHASICQTSMGARDTVTGEVLPTCDCSTPKYLNDFPIQCELNKFDSMMAHLHRHCRHGFLQVLAIDRDFHLFSRAWCIAELVQAHASQMDQHVVLHSHETLKQHSGQLRSLRVEDCSASRPEDKEAILAKIGHGPEIAEFNSRLQQLLLGSEGLFAGWTNGETLLLDIGSIAARAKVRRETRPRIPDTE